MKNNLLIAVFLFLCILSTVLSCWFTFRYSIIMTKLRDAQPMFAQASSAETIMRSMVNDTAEYNQTARNPEIAKLLQPYAMPTPKSAK